MPCLNTLAMGDKRAVAFGQASHLSVALRSGAFSMGLHHSEEPDISTDAAGLMIDDFVLLKQVLIWDEPGRGPSQPSAERLEGESRMASLHASYAGWPASSCQKVRKWS